MNNRADSAGTIGSCTGGLMIGILIGAVAAGVAVLLYAPKSGPETRALLRDEVNETQKMFQCWADELKERANRFSQIIQFKGEREVEVGGNGQQKVV